MIKSKRIVQFLAISGFIATFFSCVPARQFEDLQKKEKTCQDDVSDEYATFDELKSTFQDPVQYDLARYISDPTEKGTAGYPGPATSPRGNPGQSDSFTYVGFEAAYKFTWKKKGIYGQ